MRIISGTHKGKRLTAPSTLPVRPTTDFAKEALFNILNNEFDFENLSVIDLFSGTGNIAYEFASRGALEVRSVDVKRECIAYIDKTAFELDFHQIECIGSDVFSFLSSARKPADLIFADPPYDMSDQDMERIVTLVMKNKLLSQEGMLVVEHSERTKFDHLAGHIQHRKYGNVHFDFFENPKNLQ